MVPRASEERAPAIPTRRALLLTGLAVVLVLSAMYVLLPALAGLEGTWSRVSEGDPAWLLGCAALECLSFASYVWLFHGVFRDSVRMGWKTSYRITMAGVVATRLLAAAGAGGVVLTVWALRREGMPRREIAAREATFLVLLYSLFMGALVVFGVGLRVGLFPGPAPFGLTVIPAAFGATVIVLALAAMRYSRGLESAATRFRDAEGGLSRVGRALATAPATLATGGRGALRLIRERRPEALGAIGWWGFDIAVLAASLHAFGGSAPVSVIVMAYFVGMLANTLPVPGGIGAVDGGMIGALIGFGVDGGLAIVAVLTYRFFAFWLPIVPGVVAYVHLLRTDPAGEG